MKLLFFVLASTSFLTFSCTKETVTERVVSPDRQAPTALEQSIKTSGEHTLTLAKAQLGKAFMLIPSATSGQQTPDVTFLKPLIISFEKAGGQIALFNLTEAQLYDVIPSSRLLQTFKVVGEDDLNITVDLEKGFTSMDAIDGLGYLSNENFKKLKNDTRSGEKDGLLLKDSFVRSAEVHGNSIFIEQVIRQTREAVMIKSSAPTVDPVLAAANAAAQPIPINHIESNGTVLFEIKPYIANPSFQSKVFDKEQRIGYFLNFVVKPQRALPVPQIARWDINPEKGPITVRLQQGTPAVVRSAMQEGILYWNRVFGQDVLTIGAEFVPGERQQDRSIHVLWVPWDAAGFARAGLQADPLTGEIFRGQVFMTSSWYKMTRDDFKNLFADDDLAEKAALDSVRNVLAHEIGHVLGLRHNFSSSYKNSGSDEENTFSLNRYLTGGTDELKAAASTVMDYTPTLQTAMIGAQIKDQTLQYDRAAIGWGYKDDEIKIEKYGYCSDEHMLAAESLQKSIYGCETFDQGQNVLKGALDSIVLNEKYKVGSAISALAAMLRQSQNDYTVSLKREDLLKGFGFDGPQTQSINKFMAKDPATSYLTVPSVLDGYLTLVTSGYAPFSNSTDANNVVKKDSAAVGGYAGIISSLLALEQNENGKFYENQTNAYLDRIKPATLQEFLSPAEVEIVRTNLLEKARRADADFMNNILSSMPLPKTGFFEVGDLAPLVQVHVSLYNQTIHQDIVRATIHGVEKEYKFIPLVNSKTEALRQLFTPSAQTFLTDSQRAQLHATAETLKLASVANTLDLLQQLGLIVNGPITSAGLNVVLNQVDWNQIGGLTKDSIQRELNELKAWEELK